MGTGGEGATHIAVVNADEKATSQEQQHDTTLR
jgi:hypothetical protein